MRITGCAIRHCNAGWRDFSFLTLTTDGGLEGLAEFNECYGSPGLSAVIRRLVARIEGMDPRAHERIHQYLYAITRQAPGGVNSQAIAAIENACLDLKGQALGVPVYELLGGAVRETIPLYWSHCGTYLVKPEIAELCGVPAVRALDDLTALGRRVRDAGYTGLKTNMLRFGNGDGGNLYMPGFTASPGWPELNVPTGLEGELRDQLTALAEGAGPDVALRLDLNFNFKPEGYRQLALALDDLNLAWLEIDLYDPQALAAIRERVATPIASLESLFGLGQFRPFLEAQAVDVAIVDVPWNGAWTSLKIAALAEAFEVNAAPHNFYGHLSTLMSAHLCAAIPNFRVMEIDVDDVPWKDDLLTWRPEVTNGELALPPGPGWGARLNDEVMEAHPPQFVVDA